MLMVCTVIDIVELIDTCWDVNLDRLVIAIVCSTELIDTCWDVNASEPVIILSSQKGINRYMLGCKFFNLLPPTSSGHRN